MCNVDTILIQCIYTLLHKIYPLSFSSDSPSFSINIGLILSQHRSKYLICLTEYCMYCLMPLILLVETAWQLVTKAVTTACTLREMLEEKVGVETVFERRKGCTAPRHTARNAGRKGSF